MNILILGSEGFIGRYAVQFYLKKQWTVVGCDLFEAPSQSYKYIKLSRLSFELEDVMQDMRFDYCINAAGSGNVSYSVSHPLIDFEANALDVIRLLDALKKWQPQCRYLHISSAAVYGNPVGLPIAETHPCSPISPYGYHKWVAEIVCREYFTIYKQPIAIVRPFSVYGPGLKKQLFWELYQRYKANKAGIELWGTGQESRDFVFVEDLIAAIHSVFMSSPFECDVYNVASGKETTIAEAVHVLFKNIDNNVALKFNNQVRAGDPVNWRADVNKLLQTGYTPAVNFELGINKLAAWLKSLN